jgi:hypothetical protein
VREGEGKGEGEGEKKVNISWSERAMRACWASKRVRERSPGHVGSLSCALYTTTGAPPSLFSSPFFSQSYLRKKEKESTNGGWKGEKERERERVSVREKTNKQKRQKQKQPFFSRDKFSS